MTTQMLTKDLNWITNKIKQQNKTHKEKQGSTPRTRKCTGCGSTEKPKLAYQVTACQDCTAFMQGILRNGIQKMECNNRGTEHRLLSIPEHPYIDRRNTRSHCNRHRFIQLLTKGFCGPHIENVAIGGNEHFHGEMRKALFIGSVKVAGEKYGFHQTQNSTSVDKITKELHLTDNCSDLIQMIGSLAQLQTEQPPPIPAQQTIVHHTQPMTTNHTTQHNSTMLPAQCCEHHTNSTMLVYQGVTPSMPEVIPVTRTAYTHTGKTIRIGKTHGGGKPWIGKPKVGKPWVGKPQKMETVMELHPNQ